MFLSENSDCQDVFELARNNRCEFIDLKFIDLIGSWQHLTLTDRKLNSRLFKDGVGFDASSIRGFQSIENSDMALVPDASTAFIDPTCEFPTISLICNIRDPFSNSGYSRDPRCVAQKAADYLRICGAGDISYWGPELEFFIFNDIRFDSSNHESCYHIESGEGIWNSGTPHTGHTGYQISHKEGYFAIPPRDQTFELRNKMVNALRLSGQDILFHHHEVASAGQSEIGMQFGPLVRQADNVMIGKYIIKNVAQKNGFTVTFMPKPLFNDNGNAMHIHTSIWKDGVNLFFDANGYAQISQLAKFFIGGLLAHTPALLAFCAPSTNSYRRLVPGFEAPVNLVYSQRNRSAAIRIPAFAPEPQSRRIEYRCPDATCNPYLAFSAVLMAGLDGVLNQIDPGQPFDRDVFSLELTDQLNLRTVPGSLAEVLLALENDHQFLLGGDVFTEDLIETWIACKRRYESNPVALRPHPYEFQLYYNA